MAINQSCRSGVGVDKTRSNEQPVGVQLAPAPNDIIAYLGDAIALDGNIAPPGRASAAINDQAVTNHEICGHTPTPFNAPAPNGAVACGYR
jgi:hypothetical protein